MSRFRRRAELAAARKAAGHTQEALAALLGVDRTTVATWESGEHAPMPHVRPVLAQALGCSVEQVGGLVDGAVVAAPGLEDLAGWVDARAGWTAGTCARRVAEVPAGVVPAVGRAALVEALSSFYGAGAMVRGSLGGVEVVTSVVARTGWLGLGAGMSRFELAAGERFEVGRVSAVGAGWAVRRLAEARVSGARITDSPLYRLVGVGVGDGVVRGRVGLASFVDYALTGDLLERELVEVAASGGVMLLREELLPDLGSVFDVGGRLCVGGVPAVFAVARPGGDFVVLVQERSRQVVNAAGRLAVIPKGFHGPLNDVRGDVGLGATVMRELEEELFGRGEVDSTAGGVRMAAPMHESRLSEPMRWLTGGPGRLRVECTGVGLNLVSGNYEFAGLVVVDEPEFWERFGGSIEANWESAGLMLYSTRDADSMKALIADDRWSNEGLFALLLGLARLREIGGDRVELPAVEVGLGG
ncbi:helix-turn-helix transcriptional regulator [Actinokineospora pegani]|uniref:helix-turn-helix transcriptional regulator n=1 Tax=Actinokineospora pegani TaxID=2654637 RepID=UPI001F19176D|nr:helix-turn-helix transcriptional regulator [Actinokineospora pegani]